MCIIKPMETEAEIRGKAYVHWKCWHETYAGMVDGAYLGALTLEKVEEMAFRWPEGLLVAKDGDRVIGFVGCGLHGDDPETGEVYALYVLPEYQGRGVGRRLLDEALARLSPCSTICLWAVKDNARAIRFYERNGFRLNGTEKFVPSIRAAGVMMVKER